MGNILLFLCTLHAAMAACPYTHYSRGAEEHDADVVKNVRPKRVVPRASDSATRSSQIFLDQFTLNDSDTFLTSDAGGPIADQTSLKAGERGPTLLEDFIFRQKIQHFDHERVI
jgi:catalase